MINNIKRFKKLMFGLAALCLAFGLVFSVSAFKGQKASQKPTGYFYRYNGPNYSETEIKDYTNYEISENDCENGNNVCGVFLLSDPLGTDHPVKLELDAIANSVWASQQNGVSVNNDVISMKE